MTTDDPQPETPPARSSPPGHLYWNRFAVDERPMCVWSFDSDGDNRRFLKSIDPAFYKTIASDLATLGFDGAEGQRRAIAIRGVYGQATETLLALLAATAQAPDCVVGWLNSYRMEELRSVVTKISRGDLQYHVWHTQRFDWEYLSQAMLKHVNFASEDIRQEYSSRFARFWGRLAHEVNDTHWTREYNSLKHGLRSKAGGFGIAYGVEKVPGQRAKPEDMKSLGESKFGSSAIELKSISGIKRHFQTVNCSRNWDPQSLALRTALVSTCIANTIGMLLHMRGAGDEIQFTVPTDIDVFDEAWRVPSAPLNASFSSNIGQEDISEFTREEILAVYKRDGIDMAQSP